MPPEDQRREFIDLRSEFERKETPEARFAAAVDRLEPLIPNAHTEGHAWIKYGITKGQVIDKKGRPSLEVRQHSGAMPRRRWPRAQTRVISPDDSER